MAERLHLHDAEVLLYEARPTGALLAAGVLQAAAGAAAGAGILYAALGAAWWAWRGAFPSAWWLIPAYAACLAMGVWIKHRQRASSAFRVTTERIMLEYPDGFRGTASRTIKWPQFQESFVESAGALGALWRSKTLCLRYGSSDGEAVLRFPSLRHAKDLKHYLDKADTLIRKNQLADLKPFIEKPRGQRDQAGS